MQFSFHQADDGCHDFAIHAADAVRPDLARKHVSGRVIPSPTSPVRATRPPANFVENGTPASHKDAIYAAMRNRRLDYGPAFRGIVTIKHAPNEALAQLTLPPTIEAESARYGIHPATLDACLQTLLALTPDWQQSRDLWLPRRVEEVALHKLPEPDSPLWAYATISGTCDASTDKMVGDVFLIDEAGQILLAARGLQLQKVEQSGNFSEWLHEVRWEQRSLSLPQTSQPHFIPSMSHLQACMASAAPSLDEQHATARALATLNQIGGLSVQQALLESGFLFELGRRITLQQLIAQTRIVPTHHRLMPRLLEILTQDGILAREEEEDTWIVVRAPHALDLAALLLDATPSAPDFAPLIEIFSLASLNLAAVLAGRINAVELLFGGRGAEALAQLYSSHACWRAPMQQISQAVSAVVQRVPADRRLRILEIGAGTGGLTSHVLPVLPAERSEYVFTDLSTFFLKRGREKFAAFPFVTDKIFDVERDPISQGFAASSFDLILAANVLHATRDIRQSLKHVHQLLAPGGCLLLQEETAPERWTDLIFGLTDGWWRFDDNIRSAHPLLSPPLWISTLAEEGFEDAAVVGGGSSAACGAAVILARKHRVAATIPAMPSTSREIARWLLLADAGGVAIQLRDHLEQRGQHCLVIPASESEAFSPATDLISNWLTACDEPARAVVDLRPLDATVSAADGLSVFAKTQERAVTRLLHVLHQLIGADTAAAPKMVLITRASQATGMEAGALSLLQACLWSVARVASMENPRIPMSRIDLDSTDASQQVSQLADELLHGDAEPEVVFRGGSRFIPRLHHLDAPDADRLRLPTGSPFAINIVNRGALDGIAAHPDIKRAPAVNEVQIRVIAAGMNFRDLLNVLGAVDSVPLGLECSGIVTATGENVRDFKIGDEVFAAGLGTWRTYYNSPAALVALKPPQLRHEQAAGLPIAYLTAHFALRHTIQIRPNQRVLIHSAAGGVGLAAVHLALAARAEVFATAGSAAKRDYLRSIGVVHVFDSRTLDFAEQIAAVQGAKLDIVLNCFTGEFIRKSVDLLVEGGSFIEIGKRGIWTDEQMHQARPDVLYRVLELAQVMRGSPATLQPMMCQLAAELAEGTLPPLPIRAFPMSNLRQALHHMQQARHTGKIVLSAPACPSAESSSELSIGWGDAGKGAWLITGGLGGLGLAVAEWLVDHDVRQLVLISRRPPGDAAQACIERLKSLGATLLVASCDVADEAELAAVLNRSTRELSPLRGVFHLAGLLDDAPLQQLDWPRFATVYGPKVLGAWNLHRLTRGMTLECFVLFSSWTSMLGSAGQSNHASANAFLDALAHERRAMGLPAQTINWGAWRDTGSAARADRLAHLHRHGIGSFSTADALAAMSRFIQTDLVQVGVSPFDPAAWRAANISEWATRFTADLGTDSATPDLSEEKSAQIPLRDALQQALPGHPRRQVLEACIQRHLARVLRMSASKFDVRKSLKSLGLDSLTSLELRNHLEVDAQLKLPASLIYNHANINTLATGLAAQLGVSLEADVQPSIPGTHATTSAESHDAPNDGQLAALLDALQALPVDEAVRLLETTGADGVAQ